MKEIIGKWALVTGASSGLGVYFARILAEKGCHLVLVARRTQQLEEVKRQIQGHYENQIEIISADLSDSYSINKIIETLNTKNIHVDILINNAGYGLLGPTLDQDLSKLQKMVDLNVRALTDLTYLFGKTMTENRFGYILNVASNAAFQPVPNFAVYSATKSYVLDLSEALHVEFKKKNVVVTCLCPGMTDTEFFETAGKPPRTLKSFMLKPEAVCKRGIDALLAGEMTVVTGVLYNILIFLQRFTPRRLVANISAAIMKS